jgi:hypothetical protein
MGSVMGKKTATIEQLRESMRNAADNGYTFDGWTAERIAQDVMDCDAGFEGQDYSHVLELVRQWMGENGR